MNLPPGFELEEPETMNLPAGFEIETAGQDPTKLGPEFSPRAAAEKMLKQIQVRSSGEVAPGEGTTIERLEGAALRGLGNLGRGIAYAPLHAAKEVERISKTSVPGPSYMPSGYKQPESLPIQKAMKSVQDWYGGVLNREDIKLQEIYERHPEWETNPPENFLDLLKSPDKLAAAVIESTPLLAAAGLATAAGAPQVGYALIYVAEGQGAYDAAKQDNQSDEVARQAYVMTGSVSTVIEGMQLKGLIKIGKKSYRAILGRAVNKLGTGKVAPKLIKEAIKQSIEEQAQGTWQEATAYLLYGKIPEGGVKAFIDRRAQEGLIAFVTAGIVSGIGGGIGTAKQVAKKDEALVERARQLSSAIDSNIDLTDEEKFDTQLALKQVLKNMGPFEGVLEAAQVAGDTEVKEAVLRKVYSKGFVAKMTSIRNNADNIVAGAGNKVAQVEVMKSDLLKVLEHYDSISEDIKNNPELLAELGGIEKLLPEYAVAVNNFTESPSKEGFGGIKAIGDQIAEFSSKYGERLGEQAAMQSISLEVAAVESAEVAKAEPSGNVTRPTVEPAVQADMAREAKLAPIRLVSDSKDTSALLDTFYAERDDKEAAVDITTMARQEELKEIAGEKRFGVVVKGWDMAVQLYIDLQDNPDQMRYYDKLTANQKKLVDTARNLPPNIRAFADNLIAENKEFGDAARDQEVIHNSKENYSARLWVSEPGQKRTLFKKLGTTTTRAKARTLEGIMHGWSLGKTLKVTGATTAQNVAHKQVTQAIVDKQVMKLAKDWGLISSQQLPGWKRVEHPNFTTWKFAGKAEPGKAYGQNFFVTDGGVVMERVGMYAEPVLAGKLNTALTGSKLRGIPLVDWLSKWNAIIKQNILMTSFFHHQAYLRSYMGGGKTGIKNLNPVTAYKKGREAILNYTPLSQQLIRGGLTMGKTQDWDEIDLEQSDTIYSRAARHFKAGDKGLDAINDIKRKQKHFLFKKMGPYLKMQAALLEYRAQLKKSHGKLERGEVTQHEIAKRVASLLNDDFGGLNLRRMGRNQTTQHIFQLLALAPDWTESNIRSMTKAFKRGDEGAMYRAFWSRIAIKMGTATILFNLMMAGFDDDDFIERYKKAWVAGNLKWLDIDITPLYRLLGGSGKRKYFSLIGHFKDPLKFIAHPIRSAKHKGSVLTKMFLDVVTGEDWAGREFTTFSELIGIDDKGKYVTTSRRQGYRAGEEKGGKLKGALTKYTTGGASPVEYDQALSFILYELRSAQPIQVQSAIAFLAGEIDAFDAISKSAGLMTSTKKEDEGRKSIRR